MKWLLLTFILCVMAAPALALPNLEGTAVQTQLGTGTTVALQCGTNPNRFVHVAVTVNDGTAQMSGITYNAVSLTESTTKLVQSVTTGQQFYLNGAASGSNTLSMTVSASKIWAIVASCWSGVHPTSPIGTVMTNQGAVTSLSVSGVIGFANGIILDALGKDNSPSLACPVGSGETEIVVGGEPNSTNIRTQSSSKVATGSTTLTFGDCTNFYNMTLIALPVRGINSGGAPFVFP